VLSPHRLREGARQLGVDVPLAAAKLLCRFAAQVLQQNDVLGLTAIADEDTFLEKHLIDSVSWLAVERPQAGETLCDLGSGAGFPGIPVAVLCRQTPVTLVEASARRAAFLRTAAAGLAPGVAVVEARAEVLGRDAVHRGRYDVVVARAVAPLAVLVELAVPLLRLGGRLVAMKGPRVDEELAAAGGALDALQAEVQAVHALALPFSGAERRIVRVVKRGPTPESYPRRDGVPARRPLGEARHGRKAQEPRGSGGGNG
jgi:16S rRNA (guanine527-N7)-methyltransferase